MPKVKTKKALAKRVKITSKGTGVRHKGGKSHLLSCKTRKRKRNLRKKVVVSTAQRKLLRDGLPYA